MNSATIAAMEPVGASGRQLFDLPPPPAEGVPWLVYPNQGPSCDQQKFVSIVDGQIEERTNPHFHHATCLASAYGWMLFRNTRSRKLYLFNPLSSKRLSLPRLTGEKANRYAFSSTPEDPDCFIVAFYTDNHPYIFYAPPKGKKWEKFELNIGDDCTILAATSCNGKFCIYTFDMELLIIQFAPFPTVQYFVTKELPDHRAKPLVDCEKNLVASSTDLFLVRRLSYREIRPKIMHTLIVYRFNNTSMTWEPVEMLNDLVLILGYDFASSFPAANTKLKGNCIYFLEDNVLYHFDMEYRSLTVNYPCPGATYDDWDSFWLPQDVAQVKHQRVRNHTKEEARSFVCSYERFLFDKPKCLSTHSSRARSISQPRSCLPRWCPRTPWLMFTHKNDGTYKVLDPCSKMTYELLIPELSGCLVYTSKGGWLIARDPSHIIFFLNPFTKRRIDPPPCFKVPIVVAFSSPPTLLECTVFCISESYNEASVTISLLHLCDNKWATRDFENNGPFQLSYGSPIYLKGCFYCLGTNGSLGVYNIIEDAWRVLHAPVNIPCQAYNCTLVESFGKLLSLFINLFQKPIGIFEFDMELWCWKKITDLGDRTFFFGQGASFCVTAAAESMRNMIYFPAFQREFSFDLVAYPVAAANDLDLSTKPETSYEHVWVEPTDGILCGLNNITGKISVR